jgi:hypothetical protein
MKREIYTPYAGAAGMWDEGCPLEIIGEKNGNKTPTKNSPFLN